MGFSPGARRLKTNRLTVHSPATVTCLHAMHVKGAHLHDHSLNSAPPSVQGFSQVNKQSLDKF